MRPKRNDEITPARRMRIVAPVTPQEMQSFRNFALAYYEGNVAGMIRAVVKAAILEAQGKEDKALNENAL